jgi:glycosyltransferase involved in cell wall biosynthesis
MKKKDVVVSVIIPNYNYGAYIGQCISSVLQSAYPPEKLEIIVVDDASTDQSVKIVGDIIKNTSLSLHLVQNDTNLGLVRSRNRGIVNSLGEFLFFLDSDNLIAKNCIALHVEALQNQPNCVACYAPVRDFSNSTGELLSLRSNNHFDYRKLLHGNYIDAMAMFRKKDLVESGMFSTDMPPYGWEDYELWLRLGSENKKVHYIGGEALSSYRRHDQNMTSNINFKKRDILVTYLKTKYEVKLELIETVEKAEEELRQKNIELNEREKELILKDLDIKKREFELLQKDLEIGKRESKIALFVNSKTFKLLVAILRPIDKIRKLFK